MEMSILNNKIRGLLDNYNHDNTEYGVRCILDQWQTAKAKLINLLSKHPNWDAESFRIVFSEDYKRGFNKQAISDFIYWARMAYSKLISETYEEPLCMGMTYDKFYTEKSNLNKIVGYADEIDEITDANGYIIIKGETLVSLREKYREYEKARIEFNNKYVIIRLFNTCNNAYVTAEQATEFRIFNKFCDLLGTINDNIVDEEFSTEFVKIFPDIPCPVGIKIMKIVRKVCIKYGLDKVVELRRNVWYDDNNERHERQKDVGYNYQIAHLGDEINPLTIKRHTIISVNPLDILTMSFGNGWASCHTIDKENIRNGRGNYEGQYCTGTLSYMLDESSVIFYTVDKDYNGTEFETQDKINRVMFHINENNTVVVQGRVYPDGRDGGDESLSTQFRNVMQKVISDCTSLENLWTLKRGTDSIGSYVSSRGTHYRDYTHYNDCTVSLRKGIEEYPRIMIGHDPICPSCGNEHPSSEWLCCRDCRQEITCDRCGRGIDEDDDDVIYVEDNGEHYCCWQCAENAGCRYTEDDGWHDEDNWYVDHFNDEYYHFFEVETEDGYRYYTEDHAERDGYRETDDGLWYPEDEVYCDDHTGVIFHWNDDESVRIGDEVYENSDSANEAGYFQYDGEWYSEDDLVTDSHTGELFPNDLDGIVIIEDSEGNETYFINEENAIAEGYVKVDGEWRDAENVESEVA